MVPLNSIALSAFLAENYTQKIHYDYFSKQSGYVSTQKNCVGRQMEQKGNVVIGRVNGSTVGPRGKNFEDDTDLLFLSGFPVWAKL